MKLFAVLALYVAVAASSPTDKSVAITPKDLFGNSFGNRIISGEPAAVGQFPWQVAVNFVVSGSSYFCGGSLISNQWVLTAAHCADGASSFRLEFGGIRLGAAELTVDTTTAIVHSGYNSWLHNDVALIKMPQPINFSNNIQPISLPARGNTLGDGQTVRVSGWGKTSDSSSSVSQTLNYVDLTTITNNACAAVYGSSVIASTVCARGNPEHSTCNGDSGGPLVDLSSGVPVHVGVVSFVHINGCASGNPSGYVRTESMLDWIAEHTDLNV